ncbi:MAG: DUF975 family protein [Lachnospiraceae bacterium]|nr:DUF975 family protein [Lachnospiraceae bacterium]
MTWTRKECKTWAKEALSRNYWKIVLVSFLALAFCGAFSGRGFGWTSASETTPPSQEIDVSAYPDADTADTEMEINGTGTDSFIVPEKAKAVGITIFILIIMCTLVFLYTLQALLYNPFRVGFGRFMIKSIDDKAKIREVAYGFDHSYKNIVKTMFHYDMRVFLWSLLFIIPGFCKEYQYRLVPYILAEHPDMDYREVLKKSSDMMRGQKWKAFVLDLSFILWHIFGFMTCGIGELFYVCPYHSLTQAALYCKLNEKDASKAEDTQLLLSDTFQS